MKTYLFKTVGIIILLACFHTGRSQFSLNRHYEPNLSMHFEDWNGWKNDFFLKYTVADSADVNVLFKIYRYSDRKLLFENDSFDADFRFIGTDSIDIREFMNDYSYFLDTLLGNNIEKYNAFLEGDYRLKVIVTDTNFTVLGVDSAVCHISDTKKPALVSPKHNVGLSADQTEVKFMWIKPTNYDDPIYYQLSIVQADSVNYSDGVSENDIANCSKIKDTTIYNTTQINLTSLVVGLSEGNYIWSVRAFTNSGLTDELGSNHGMAYPFVLKRTPVNRGVDKTPWMCTETGSNIGFEANNMDGWDGWSGKMKTRFKNNGQVRSVSVKWSHGLSKVDHRIMSKFDAPDYFGFPVVHTGGGNHSVRVANLDHDYSGTSTRDQIAYKFTVAPENAHINVYYALALVDAHTINDPGNPFVEIAVTRRNNSGATDRGAIMRNTIVADFFNPYFLRRTTDGDEIEADGPAVYQTWMCQGIDLTNYIGETVTLKLTSGDCSRGPHWAYGYFDFCVNDQPDFSLALNNTYCNGDPVIATISNVVNATGISYKVTECNQSGSSYIGESAVSGWFNGRFMPTFFDAAGFYNYTLGKPLQCNKYYKVEVFARTNCALTKTREKIIYISCPGFGAAGPDVCSYLWTTPVQIGTTPKTGYTYSWSPNACLSSNTIANPIFNPNMCLIISGTQLTYTLTVTDANGCTSTDQVIIFSQPPSNFNLDSVQSFDPCKKVLRVTGNFFGNLTWYINGVQVNEGTEYVFTPTVKTTVTVSSTTPCGTVTKTITVWPINGYKDFTSIILIHPNALQPSSSSYYRAHFNVWELGKANLAVPSYGAIKYELWVVDRWNGHHMVKSNTGGNFANGEIEWDGKLDGALAPDGTYPWFVRMWNCKNINSDQGFWNFTRQTMVRTNKRRFHLARLGWVYDYVIGYETATMMTLTLVR